jgi:2'-5' RNA ligase
MAEQKTVRSESWRLFIAIELPPEVRRKISQHVERLRSAVPDVRASWIREENLHLTLKFLGDIPVERVEVVSAALAAAASQIAVFEVLLTGCGAFPPRDKPNVLWIGIEDSTRSLDRVHAAIEDKCADAGIARDTRSFRPHLTLARLRESRNARQLVESHKELGCGAHTMTASDLCLIRSELRPEGSRYTVIGRYAFKDEVRTG